MNTSNTVTCLKCGTVHFTVDPQDIKDWASTWIDFWLESSYETRDAYGLSKAPPGPKDYFMCGCGNSYKNFRDFETGDMPDGCTISPILHYKY